VSGNSAGFLYGGGIYAGTVNLTNCTVSGNSAASGGGIYANDAISLQGSVVSGNYKTNGDEDEIYIGSTTQNGNGELVTDDSGPLGTGSTHYIIGIPSGGLSELMETESKNINGFVRDIGKLKDNGGEMLTILPATDSPMLDAIPVDVFESWFIPTAQPANDQRGAPFERLFGTGIDIGALEARYAAPPVITQQPEDTSLMLGQTDTSLKVVAVSSDSGMLSYQWYSNMAFSNIGGSEILGATGSSYTPPATALGELYYYVAVTNTTMGLDLNKSTTVSSAVTVTVNKRTPALALSADPPGSMALPGTVKLTATLSGAYPGVSGLDIVFIVDGVSVGMNATNASGMAVFVLTDPSPKTYSFGASFAGDGNNESADASIAYTVTQNTAKSYRITATSDALSAISPKGAVDVQKGANQTFIFSAAQGYSVSAVTVDGAPLSKEQIALGQYTFRNVSSNHTIDVKGVAGANVKVKIDTHEGKGRVEYSTDGGQFKPFTPDTVLPEFTDVIFRAVADDGYRFVKWETSSGTFITPEIILTIAGDMPQLEVFFEKENGADEQNDNIIWWALGAVALVVIVGLILVIFFRSGARTV
jgi:predicted outer membrane repeat protein